MPLWVIRLAAFSLGLLGHVWPGALRYQSFARFLLIVSQYDAIGESCGSRRMADYMQELAARENNGGRIADGVSLQSNAEQNGVGEVPRDGKKLL